MRTISSGGLGGRSSVLWGKGGRGLVVAALLVLGLCAPAAALAAKGKGAKDMQPPTTTVTAGPADLSSVAGAVTFAFTADEPATFQCSVDSSPFAACTSPYTVPAPVFGQHVFTVRATDTAGNVEASPPTRTWFTPYASAHTYLPGSFLARVQANPTQMFDVIVQLPPAGDAQAVASNTRSKGKQSRKGKNKVSNTYQAINGFEAQLEGWLILWVAENYPVVAITPNTPVSVDDYQPAQVWPKTIHADRYWTHGATTCAIDATTGLQTDPACVPLAPYTAPDAPTIAIVDSGIDGTKTDFGNRVIGHTVLESDDKDVNADDDGHGTFVASMAAGASATYPGAAPTARLYDVRAIGPDGSANTSDVIAAADWILAHKDEYNIKVANFSLHAGRPNSFRFDPLDRAVESLWFSGVVVVVASGNFGVDLTTPSAMDFAPGNDPFVITVGAADTLDTETVADDSIAPWSAWGHTADGFAKPELSAPGRYMIGAVPDGATMMRERPDHVVAPGYMQLSGTSFAAPVVAGVAANLLALHASWTPDQVKGALMSTAHQLTSLPNTLATGVGEIDERAAAELATPPNANAALDRFVVADSTAAAGVSFADQSWVSAASADMSWASQSWSDMSWASQSWSDMSWASQSWSDSSQADAALADMSWASSSRVD